MRIAKRLLLVFLALVLAGSTASASEWLAARLRGTAYVMVANDWQPLSRGDAIPDGTTIRTTGDARLRLERGNEQIELAGESQIRIIDQGEGVYTTVQQDFGVVTVDADVRKVEHFAVETPQLAAVVKGTRFTVLYGSNIAEVRVQRGRVYVENRRSGVNTVVGAGQRASVADADSLEVKGNGKLPEVLDSAGNPAPGNGNGLALGLAKQLNGEAGQANGLVNGVANGLANGAGQGKGLAKGVVDSASDTAGSVLGGGNGNSGNGNGNNGNGNNGNNGNSNNGNGNGSGALGSVTSLLSGGN